jgi:hypothetical protein
VEVESTKHRGMYVDPAGGRKRFGELAEAWAEVQDWKDSTRQGWPDRAPAPRIVEAAAD